MKNLFLKVALLGFVLSAFLTVTVFPQQKDSVSNQTVQTVSIDPGQQIVLPAIPDKGASLWTWVLWVLAVGVAIDTVIRFIPTSGKFSWVTKLLKILHDVSLYLDNTKKSFK